MKFIKNIKALRKDLSLIFIIAIFTIVLIDFWLINIPELFRGAYKIGQIIYRISFAYISSFIFYFLVVHLKSQKDKQNLYGYIAINASMIIGQAKGLINELAKNSNITLQDTYPNSEELNSICLAIDPNTNAPLLLGKIGNYANWFQYFDYYKRRSNEASSKILSKLQFLDSELVHKLARIEDCNHFNVIQFVLPSMPIRNSDLSAFESGLSEYFDLIKDLEVYYNVKLKEYK